MSFEVFLQRFENGQPSGMSADAVRNAFTNFEDDSEPDYWHLRYAPNDDCHVHVSRPDDAHQQISALSIHRPCVDLRLWDSVLRLLQLGQWVLYWPAEPPPLVMADAEYANHLPAGMREALGPIRVVRSGDEILQLIRAS